jgi:hypothetical protein
MPFDLASAKPVGAPPQAGGAPAPVASGGFDLGTAKPVGAPPAQEGPSVGQQILEAPVGAGEMLLQGATGLVAQPIAGLGGLAAGATNYFNRAIGSDTPDINEADVVRGLQNQLTYQPQSRSAAAGAATIASGVNAADRAVAQPALEAIGNVSPTAENVVRTAVPAAAEILSSAAPVAKLATAPGRAVLLNAEAAAGGAARANVTNAARQAERVAASPLGPATTAEEVLQRQAASSAQNMGAAAAAPSLANVSPELKAAIVDSARKTGGAINPEALQRLTDADEVFRGTGAKLSEGQALQDARLISEEQNMRGRVPEFGKQFEAQAPALARRLQTIRDEAGPDVFSANHVEHGDTLMNAYRTVDEARSTAINKAYADLRAAAGGNFPIGGKSLLDDVNSRLHSQLITDHAPRSIMNALEGFAAKPGSMTFENFEAMRTNLATIQRTATDGLERKAAGLIRQAMEDLPLAPGAAKLKPLADRARALARERFQAIEADPAYDAVVNGSVEPDDFVRKFVTGGKRDNLTRMAQTIGTDPGAQQTLAVAALDYLRDAARLNPHFEGNFAADSFNKALQKLGPGVQSILPAKVVEQVEQLGRVARATTFRPRGEFVNSSNTFTAAAAEGVKEGTKGAAEGVANVAAGGVPVGTWIRKGMEGAAHRRQARRSFDPRSALSRLPETTRQ